MSRRMPYPLLWAMLVVMWLLLNGTLDLAQLLIGALVGAVAVRGLAALQPSQGRLRRPRAALGFAWLVLRDVVRSNIAVARIVTNPGTRGKTSGFLDIELALRSPVALAALACVITSTPGTAWAGYDPRTGVLSLHILDLVDEAVWIDLIKGRYERRLMEIFE